MVNITRLADKELRYIIREFVELEKLLSLSKKEVKADSSQECQRLLVLLKRGLRKEERVEYRAAKNFTKLRKAVVRARSGTTLQESQRITELIRQADIYDNTLKKLSASGGEIEKKLELIAKNPTIKEMQELQVLLEQAISADRSFDVVISELIQVMQGNKTTRSALLLEETYSSLAMVSHFNALILFDFEKVKKILRDNSRQMQKALGAKGSPLVGKRQKAYHTKFYFSSIKERKEIEAYKSSEGGYKEGTTYQKLYLIENRIFKEAIIGYCDFDGRFIKTDIFCGSLEFFRVAAKKGYGVLMFELAFSYAATFHRAVVIDRGEGENSGVSKPARKVLEYFDLKRRDVLKYPAMLAKYPELIGYSKESAIEKFGTKGVYYSSTFNRYGFPIEIPEEKQNELISQLQFRPKSRRLSYQEKEGGSKREIVGGLASLDKAYYYDGKKGLLQHLLAKWQTAGELSGLLDFGATSGSYKSAIYNAGYAFFQSFNKNES
ncbi:MAG: hypothetical protein ABIH82_03215 [Candidatus Woesearchaeota archaeon]